MNNDINNEPKDNISEDSAKQTESTPTDIPAQEPKTDDIPSENTEETNPVLMESEDNNIGLDDDLNFETDFQEDAHITEETPVYQPPQYAYPQNPQQVANEYYPPQTNPQFENTNEYYTPPADGYYPPPAEGYYYPVKPKKSKGATALIISLWVLVGIFALGFFTLCGYIIGTSNYTYLSEESTSHQPTLFPDENEIPSTEDKGNTPTQIPNSEETIPLPDKDKDMYSDSVKVELNPFPADHTNKDKYTTQYAYKTVADSTIGVVCYEPNFIDEPVSQGTGIIISKDGYIATNSHVIGDSRTLYYVQVITNDGTIYEAKVIGYDSRTDLAVLKINATNLTPATFCNSEYVEVGQDVVAVGNPGGIEFQNSLTKGIVSALDRELSLSSQVSYIQTDAAINPGNSGGPLCNMYGQVIGINTAKISSDSYEGMGFAIPSATVKEIVDDLISQGYVNNRVRLGISGAELDQATQQYFDVPAGILINEVTKNGPCDGVGIEKNDILTAIDDEKVTTFADVYAILAKHAPGDKVVLSVYKYEQDKTVEITVTLMADQGETQQ